MKFAAPTQKLCFLNKYSPEGRQLLLDFVSGEWDPVKAGCVAHWQSNPIYYENVTKHAFRSQARSIAKDVLAYIPDDLILEQMIAEATMEVERKKKAKSKRAKSNKDKMKSRNSSKESKCCNI